MREESKISEPEQCYQHRPALTTRAQEALMADSQPTSVVETWKPVVGWERTYEVSDRGRVRSITRTIEFTGRWGPTTRFIVGKLVVQRIRPRGGYCVVTLGEANKTTCRLVHDLVLLAFVGPRPPTMECCHNDGDPTNNSVSNLRWDTHAANQADMVAHGTVARGERNAGAKLSSAQVAEIRAALGRGVGTRALSQKFVVTITAIRYIRNGKTWREPCTTNAK